MTPKFRENPLDPGLKVGYERVTHAAEAMTVLFLLKSSLECNGFALLLHFMFDDKIQRGSMSELAIDL